MYTTISRPLRAREPMSKGNFCIPPICHSPGVGKTRVRKWRQLAAWRRQMWRQDVASQPHEASRRHLASPDVASARGVTTPRSVTKTDLAPGRGVTSSRGVREPNGVNECGVGEWRLLPQRAQAGAATRHYSPAGQETASQKKCEWPHVRGLLSSPDVASTRGVRHKLAGVVAPRVVNDVAS